MVHTVVYSVRHTVGLQRIKKEPFSTVAVEFGVCRNTRGGSNTGRVRDIVGYTPSIEHDVHTPLPTPYFSMALLHASFRDRISICNTYACCIAARKKYANWATGPILHFLFVLPFNHPLLSRSFRQMMYCYIHGTR